MDQSKSVRWLVSLVVVTGFASMSSTTVWADGSLRLAYLSSLKGPAQIYLLDENGKSKQVKVTSHKSDYRSPQLSPDGGWIAFHSQHDSKPGLFIVRSSGGAPRHLTKEVTRFLGWQYAWSPDSKRIAFLAHPGKKGADIHVVDIATGKVARLTTGGSRSPAWSPDGKSIAYMTWTGDPHTGLCVMKADGTDQRQLSSEGHRDSFPSWSPDSRKIAFRIFRRVGGHRSEVYVIDVKGGKPKKLLDKEFSVVGPAWSPDGTRIAVRTGADGWGIDVVDVKTGKRTRIIKIDGITPLFWYDADRLVFEAEQDGNREIFAVKIGDQPVNLTKNPASDRLPRSVGPNRFGVPTGGG